MNNQNWEVEFDREFEREFIRKDDGLLNIDKYDHQRLETFIKSLLDAERAELVKEVEGMPTASRAECQKEKVICADDLIEKIKNK